MIKIFKSDGRIVAEKILIYNTFFKRAMGLMFKKKLEGCDGILLSPCSSIHSFFMYMDIDCFFLDREQKVLKILRNFPPSRISSLIRGAYYVLEVQSGRLPADYVSEGEILKFDNI